MELNDIFNYAIRNLLNRKLRSWLTIIGVVIGVITIVTVMSVGEGLKNSITKELESFGTDKMFVVPINIEKSGFSAGGMSQPTSGKLFEKDVDRILKVPGVKSVSKMVYGRTSLEFKDKKISALVYATVPSIFEEWTSMYQLEEGRFFKDSETDVAVLGNDAANVLFGKNQIKVGNFMIINDKKYRVVGILKKIGTALSQSDDASIFIPFDDGKVLFSKQLSKDEISFISIQTEPGFDTEKIKEKIEFELASLHRVTLDEKDFTVVTSDFINKTIGSVLDLLSLFLFFITMISAVVGGIGIANTMFMSVIERTKEIGILKAVGASRSDILRLFLVESAIIGFFGGLVGLVLGLGLLFLVSQFSVPVLVKIELAAFALLFSVGVGLISGIFPARKASNMNAIEALSFE